MHLGDRMHLTSNFHLPLYSHPKYPIIYRMFTADIALWKHHITTAGGYKSLPSLFNSVQSPKTLSNTLGNQLTAVAEMAQDKDAPVPGRRRGSSEYSISSGTLDAMNTVDLSTPAKSERDEVPFGVKRDDDSEVPPGSSMSKRRLRSEDTSAVIQATRLRSNVKTTPNASKSIKNAHERRAQQTPDNGINSPPNPSPQSDGDTADPFTSPNTVFSMFGSQESTMHSTLPSLPVQQQQQQQQQTDFVLPQDLGMYTASSDYVDPNLFAEFLPESKSDSGSSAAYDQQWMPPPVGLSSRNMPPPIAPYATKPQPEAYVQHTQQYPQRYPSRELQPLGYAVYPSHGNSGYHQYHHADYPPHPPGLRGPLASSVNSMMMPPSMSDPQVTYGDSGIHAPPPSPLLRPPPMHILPPQPFMNIIPPTPFDKGKERAVQEGTQPQPHTNVAPTLPDKGKQRAAQEVKGGSHRISGPQCTTPSPPTAEPQDLQDIGMSAFSSASEADEGGRWRDDTLEASLDVFNAMDANLHAFCAQYGVKFSRAVKEYSKRHNVKLPAGNLWNTYCQMHAHPDYTQCELDRVKITTSAFDALSSDDQQRVRSECWAAFQKTFSSRNDCRIALDLFRDILSVEEKEHGTTLARREKQFNVTVNSFTHAADIASREQDIEYIMFFSGTHVHSDQALVSIKMSNGMNGFLEDICKSSVDKMKGHIMSWCFAHKSKEIAYLDRLGGSSVMGSPLSSTSSLQPSQVVEITPALEGAKPSTKARTLLRSQMVASGYQLADGQNVPWLTLSMGCAQSGVVCRNWPPDCRFPSEFERSDRGIEGAPVKEIRALVAQFQDSKHPLTFQKVEKQADRQALVNSVLPVVTTYIYGKPLQRRVLFANNVVKIIYVDPKLNPDASGPATSQAAALDPLPSSELTALEFSSSSSPDPSPSPEKRQPARRIQPARNTEPGKTSSAPSKRTIHAVSPGSADSDGESPPKRANTKRTNGKLPTSDSSMEVSEIQQPPPTTTTGKASAGRKKTAAVTSKAKTATKKRQPKSQKYVIEDSDDEEEGKEKGKTAEDEAKVVPERPKPRPRRQAGKDLVPTPSSSLGGPAAPSTPRAVNSTLPLPPAPPSTDLTTPKSRLQPDSERQTPLPQGDPELQAALKRHCAPNRPGASVLAKKLAFASPGPLEARPDKPAPAVMLAVASAPTQREPRVGRADTPIPSALLPRSSDLDAATAQADTQRSSSDTRSAGPPSAASSNGSTGGQPMTRERSVPYPEYSRGVDGGAYQGYGHAEGHYDGRTEGRYNGRTEGRYDEQAEIRYDRRAEGRYDGHYFDDRYGPRGLHPYPGYSAAPPTRGDDMDSRNYRYPPASYYPSHSHRPPSHHDYRQYGNTVSRYTHSREPSPGLPGSHQRDVHMQPPSPYMGYAESAYHPSAPPAHRQRHPDATVLSRVASPQAGPSRLA
ncbi:hypothetical protein FIBSPDRAFT_885592 [Athelia psychrophila]|uniref:Uncharacterized protein n=1 Tax=Athelia psychrophila TaxID=1759441 RepID=A0A166RWU9_9AGAM|nr:hypothetical protein FIBSPDRAFT_885592 [Fibularhizoctonia sp. CBS 109695]